MKKKRRYGNMKYKKWWLPAVFMVISCAWLICAIFVFPLLAPSDSGYGGLGIGLIGLALWFFLILPVLSFIYSRKVLEEGKDRFPMTLYNSFLMTLPTTVYYGIVMWELNAMDVFWIASFIWCEMWAIVGLSGKGKYKKVGVWYVPAFLFVAALTVQISIDQLLYRTFPDAVGLVSLLFTCAVVPVALFIYARACVKQRKKKIGFTVVTSFLLSIVPFSSVIISAIRGVPIVVPARDIVVLALIYAVTFAIYEIAALLGAGYKIRIKFPKRKKKAVKEEKSETVETTEEDN